MGILAYALRHHAEQGIVALVVLGWAAERWRPTRAAAPTAYTVAVAVGALATLFRADRARLGVFDYPWMDWGGFVAMLEAGAAQSTWLATGLCALAVAADGRRVDRPRADRAVPAAAAGLGAAVAGLGAPHLAWDALVWAALAVSAAYGAPWRRIALATALASVSTAFGGAASLAWVLVLVDPGHAASLDAAVAGAALGAVVGLGLGAEAARRARPQPWPVRVAVVSVLGAAVVAAGWMARGLAHGPTADIAAWAADVPVLTPRRAARVPGGCVVDGAGERHTIGALVDFDGVRACPAGDFPAADTPLFALPADAPVERLATARPGAGDVAVLTRTDRSPWLAHWRVNAVRLPVWPGPAVDAAGQVTLDPASRPLPGAVLLARTGAGLVAVSDQGRRPVDGARAALPTTPRGRQDVLVHSSAAPTVGAWLQTCAEAREVAPRSRCVLALGDVDRWERQLTSPAGAKYIDAEWDTIVSDEVIF